MEWSNCPLSFSVPVLLNCKKENLPSRFKLNPSWQIFLCFPGHSSYTEQLLQNYIPLKPQNVKECEVAQSCPTLYNTMDCGLPGFSIHGIFQTRALDWVAISLKSQPSSFSADNTIGSKYHQTGTTSTSAMNHHQQTQLHSPHSFFLVMIGKLPKANPSTHSLPPQEVYLLTTPALLKQLKALPYVAAPS